MSYHRVADTFQDTIEASAERLVTGARLLQPVPAEERQDQEQPSGSFLQQHGLMIAIGLGVFFLLRKR